MHELTAKSLTANDGSIGVICLDSDNESEDTSTSKFPQGNQTVDASIPEYVETGLSPSPIRFLNKGVNNCTVRSCSQSGQATRRTMEKEVQSATKDHIDVQSNMHGAASHDVVTTGSRDGFNVTYEEAGSACKKGFVGGKSLGSSSDCCVDVLDSPASAYQLSNCRGTYSEVGQEFPAEKIVLDQVIDEEHIEHEKNRYSDVDIANGRAKKVARNKKTKEDELRLKEERKLKKEHDRMQKVSMKAEAAKMKQLQKEKERWEKGKLATKSIVVELDAKVVEMGLVGGSLLSRLAEKGLDFRITSNPFENSIVRKMNVPDHIAQLSPKGQEVLYILFIHEAEAFCNMVAQDSFINHVRGVRSKYPSYTICYGTNRLMSYINKREQAHYKNPTTSWRRPPIEEAISMLTSDFVRVHSRQCLDEAEIAEHVVGLTSSLATCQFRPDSFIPFNSKSAVISL